MTMPTVLCGGRVTITAVDALGTEVQIALGPAYLVYMKRTRHESYDDFIKRVTAYCEKNGWA